MELTGPLLFLLTGSDTCHKTGICKKIDQQTVIKFVGLFFCYVGILVIFLFVLVVKEVKKTA
jgi:hypothetical protein